MEMPRPVKSCIRTIDHQPDLCMRSAYQKPMVQVWEYLIALVSDLGCYQRENLCKYCGCYSQPKGEDSKMEVFLAYHKTQELAL